jgi:hypothetical protein
LPSTIGISFIDFRASVITAFIRSAFTAAVTGTPACIKTFCFSLAILIASALIYTAFLSFSIVGLLKKYFLYLQSRIISSNGKSTQGNKEFWNFSTA